ncbi:hypothetical protein E1176_10600 [Fulvivirga sp. RKSG066]|uniref:hypothetical protein n=1 Tax=Fulvivirga aurantia TaxID=2529383 RepID=UPI0012BBCBD1|nr:hypothetical protein [Fulvivirga aurantia]MTI21467.1 hypothetical protein [Fulvivirga aurantia]
MEIIRLKQREEIERDPKLKRVFERYQTLLSILRERELPVSVISVLNNDIDQINSVSVSEKELRKLIVKKQNKQLTLIEKKAKIVSKNHYRNLWMTVGMSAFGLPFGVALGSALGNMAFLGVGLPIGMAIGIGVGMAMDKNAFEQGRQIDFEYEM